MQLSSIFFVVCRALGCWFVCDCIPPPSPPIYILVVVIVWHVCSHLSSFHLPIIFHSFISMVFIIINIITIIAIIIILLWTILFSFHWMSSSVTDTHTCGIILCFVNLLVGVGACGWVVDTTGHGGGSTLQGLGCWPTVGLFWAPDLHLQYLLYVNYVEMAIITWLEDKKKIGLGKNCLAAVYKEFIHSQHKIQTWQVLPKTKLQPYFKITVITMVTTFVLPEQKPPFLTGYWNQWNRSML